MIKIFSNKIVLFFTALVVMAGSIFLYTTFSGSGEGPITRYSGTPDYNRIILAIDKMKRDDITQYNLYKNDIKVNIENKLISSKESDELSIALNNKYLSLLSASIKRYCGSADKYDVALINRFSTELAGLPVTEDMQLSKTSIQRLLTDFSNAAGLKERITVRYASNLMYKDFISNGFEDQMASYERRGDMNCPLLKEDFKLCKWYLQELKKIDDNYRIFIDLSEENKPAADKEKIYKINGKKNDAYYDKIKKYIE